MISQLHTQYDFLMTAPPINVGGAVLHFNGASRTLISGTDLQAGALYKYTNVATISGTQIDAYVKITGITNAAIQTIDNDAPAAYTPPAGTIASDLFAPEIKTTAAGGHVDFAVNFKDPAGNDLTLLNFFNNSIDVDGSPGNYMEFVEYGGFKSYTVGNPTDLLVTPGVISTDRMRFTGTQSYNLGLEVNEFGRVQANFDAISTLQISMGADKDDSTGTPTGTGDTGGTYRQYGSLFSAVSFAGATTTTAAPTVDLLTTIDNTPQLTGTVGTVPLVGGESFRVTVNNVIYNDQTLVNGVKVIVSGTGWTLDVPVALSAGVYEVRAERSTQYDQPGALPVVTLLVADQSHNELVVNNAPVLNDTPLMLTVTEDAPAPSGAVGSLLSAFTGGISDWDPGASKGLAIIGSNETNGTWYFTTDGGTTWTGLNQFNGAVGTTNALLLADDASTRLYFRPNADYNLNVSSALTIRAWDQTRGTGGTKVDPADPTIGGGVGGVYAFSTATDVVDVTVLSVNDAPVRTAGSVANLTVNEDAAITSLGLGTVTYTVGGGGFEGSQTLTPGGTPFTVTSVPAASLGNVYLADGTTVVTANTAYTLTQLRGMQFKALADANGVGTFSYKVQDDGGTANGGVDSITESLTITVNPVNDAPVNTVPGSRTVNEDTSLAFTAGNAISVNDVDGNLATTKLTVASGALNVNLGGGATISAGANNSATLTLSGTQAQINAALATLTYQGNANFNGSDSLQVLSTDSAGTPLSDTDTVAITVTSVNDAPVNSLPIGQSINTSGTLTFSAGNGNLLSVSDVDTANLTVTLAVGAGTLSLSTTAGLAFTVGDGTTDATMTFSGSQASINTALAGLRYFAPASAQAVTLTVTTNDLSASPVVNTVPIAVTVAGTPVIDLNTGTAGTGFSATYVENAASPVNITSTSSITDSNSANMSQATITIGNFVAGDTLTWTNQAGIATSYNSATGVLTATGAATKATYQTLLQSVKFSTASDNPTLYGASPTRSISVVVKDDTAVSSNTAISTITVTPVNDAPVQATGSTLNYTEMARRRRSIHQSR